MGDWKEFDCSTNPLDQMDSVDRNLILEAAYTGAAEDVESTDPEQAADYRYLADAAWRSAVSVEKLRRRAEEINGNLGSRED